MTYEDYCIAPVANSLSHIVDLEGLTVICHCGYEESFTNMDDADAAYEIHNNLNY